MGSLRMINEYQVFFRDGQELRDRLVRAENEKDAQKILEEFGFKVLKVGPGRALLDWSQRTFDSAEACEYLHCSRSTLTALMGQGELPKSRNGNPIFHVEWLDRYISKSRMELKPDHVKAA
jgi:hypothetical protein